MASLNETLKNYMPGAGATFKASQGEIDLAKENAAPTRTGEISIHGNRLKYYNGTTSKTLAEAGTTDAVANIIRPQNLKSLDIVAALMPDFVRAAAGDFYWERTAAGAETLYFTSLVPLKIETASTGAKLTGVKIAYELATADPTSIDVTCTSTVYAQGVNPAVTASHGGAVVDGDYDANHNTAAKRVDRTVTVGEHVLTLTLNTPAFYVTAGGEVRIAFTVVLANTCVFRLRAFHPIYTEAIN